MRTWPIIALALPLTIAACAKEQVTTHAANPAFARTVTRTETKTQDQVQLASLDISDEIARRCHLPTAHFPFDSAAVSAEAQTALDELAHCFTAGELSGQRMKIVGHADPRGTPEYNLGLGQRRAGAVAEYLNLRGLPPDRVETSSLGEIEATGTTEEGWARDRRVEILISDEAVVLEKGKQPKQTEH
jgi:peptidoglycan-associated lipoprotein